MIVLGLALVSVAVGLDIDAGMVRDVRIVLGGVAHKPWRAFDAEAVVRGKTLDAEVLARAGAAAVAGAAPLADNAFKVELAQRVRALRRARRDARTRAARVRRALLAPTPGGDRFAARPARTIRRTW